MAATHLGKGLLIYRRLNCTHVSGACLCKLESVVALSMKDSLGILDTTTKVYEDGDKQG